MSWPGRHLIDVDELSTEDVERVMSLADVFVGVSTSVDPSRPARRTAVRRAVDADSALVRDGGAPPGRGDVRAGALASSMVKGETLGDTVRNLDALGFRFLVVRHHRAGAAAVAARYFGGSVVNAGDGWHAHPTQALLDLFTLRRHFGSRTT